MERLHEIPSPSKVKARIIPLISILMVGAFLGVKLFQDGSIYRSPFDNPKKNSNIDQIDSGKVDTSMSDLAQNTTNNVTLNGSDNATASLNETTISPNSSAGQNETLASELEQIKIKYLGLEDELKRTKENLQKFMKEVYDMNETFSKLELIQILEHHNLTAIPENNP